MLFLMAQHMDFKQFHTTLFLNDVFILLYTIFFNVIEPFLKNLIHLLVLTEMCPVFPPTWRHFLCDDIIKEHRLRAITQEILWN